MELKLLVAYAAGFIGSALVLRVLERSDAVIGVNNHNALQDWVCLSGGGAECFANPLNRQFSEMGGEAHNG